MRINYNITISLFTILVLTVNSNANYHRGQQIYAKFLKKECGYSSAKFASQHTRDEWELLKKNNKFKDEIKQLCPSVEENDFYISKFEQDLYDFAWKYASDSGMEVMY